MVLRLLKRKLPRKEHVLKVDGMQMPVKVSENARAKRMTLRIAPGGSGLKVTIPPHVGDRELQSFLERNRNWVAARISRLPEKTVLCEGSIIPYKGVDHKIVHLDRPRGVVEAREIAGEACIVVPGDPQAIPRKLLSFLKMQARKELDAAVVNYSNQLGVRAKSIRITDTTSRWGSCSTTRTLSFSWRVIMAPPEVLQYLAAHEVAHLREMNHSDRFWTLVHQICPDMERHKTWLRNHGNSLHCIEIG